MAAWYALNVTTGSEGKVADFIEDLILSNHCHPMVLDVLSGCRIIIRQTKKGDEEKAQPIFPRYIYVKLKEMKEKMDKEIWGQIWHFFKAIPGVSGGILHNKPVSQTEIDHLIEICAQQSEVEMVVEKVEQSEPLNSDSFIEDISNDTFLNDDISNDDASSQDIHGENEHKEAVLQNMIQWVTKGKKQIVKIPMSLYNFIFKYDITLLKLLRKKGLHCFLSAMNLLMKQVITRERDG